LRDYGAEPRREKKAQGCKGTVRGYEPLLPVRFLPRCKNAKLKRGFLLKKKGPNF